MSERTKRMKENMFYGKNPISCNRLRIMIESNRENQAMPFQIKEGRYMERYYDEVPIWIKEDELIVGAGSSVPNGMEASFHYGTWNPEEIDSYKADGFAISEEDEAFLREAIANDRILGSNDAIDLGADDRFNTFLMAGYTSPPWPPRKPGHKRGDPRSTGACCATGTGTEPPIGMFCYPYETLYQMGLEALLEQVKEARRNIRYAATDSFVAALNLDAMEMELSGLIRHCQRYSTLAREMAEKETREWRKKELLEIAEICKQVPAKPARTFREAIQFFWFLFLTTIPSQVASMGRLDQHLYSYYKADKEAGRITDEEVVELFECLRFKCMEQETVAGKQSRERTDGKAKWYNAVIAGVKADGTDASNELTLLIMEALQRSPVPHHTITVRVAKSTPEEVMQKAVECQALGLTMPAFVSDESYTKFWHEYEHMPLEEAREWCIAGCLDAVVPGKTLCASCYMTNPMLMFLGWLNNGVDPNFGMKCGPDTPDLDSFRSYEEMYDCFLRDGLQHYMVLCGEKSHLELLGMRLLFPRAVNAALMIAPIEKGMGFYDNWNEYDLNRYSVVGMVNLGEALHAIKTLVYEEKVVTLSELKKALDANWVGYEDLHAKIKALPRYGNDIDGVDEIVAKLYADWEAQMWKIPVDEGRFMAPAGVSITAYDPLGKLCGASPDGRCAQEILADGCASPTSGGATNGILSVLKSAMKINQDAYSAFLLNQKFSADALKNESDRQKLSSAIRTYLTNGGKHIQFNVINQETLRDAQEHPENYEDLMVRVAGYSAYFNLLSERVQDQLIDRTSHGSV